MSVIRGMKTGYAILMFWVAVLAGLGAAMAIWVDSWQSGFTQSIEQAQAASQIAANAAAMDSYGLVAVVDADKDRRAEYAVRVDAEAAAADQALDTVQALADGNAERLGAVESLRGLLRQYHQTATDTIGLATLTPVSASNKLRDEVVPLGQQLQEATTSFKESAKAEQTANLDRLGQMTGFTAIFMPILGVIALIGGFITSWLLSRRMRQKLTEAVEGISSSAAELLAVSSQVAASAAQTATATNETTATVEEVKQTAQLAHEKASLVADSSQSVAQVAGAERATVEETVTAFERIQTQMGMVAEAIKRLSEQTQAVGDIITTVNDIAEQSNLLSVNASIEAAKAGDQGKGFTVVAQEVKNLAEQSKQAVAQVRAILGEIQKASTLAVQAADHSREAMEAGRHQIEEAGEGTMALADSATEAAQSAVQISASSRQQLAGMEQISQAIESINQAGTQSAAGTRQVEQEVTRLRELALNLKRLVDSRATA